MTGVGGPVLLVASGPELERGDVLAGRYQIEALIGTGGSGRVLRAFDRVAREPVALKILRPEYATDPLWTERFSRELRVGRQIQHKNVCRIFDIGEADGHRFLSMELATRGTVRGELGTAALARPLDHRIADARAVVEGAAALHAAGIVHRDLKPENLLRMQDGRLVVSDFGLATDPGSGPTTTIMVGTPRYMAAEVVMGDPATSRSDVWALGIVMHEILFGVRPDFSVVRRGNRRFTAPGHASSARERRLAELCGRCAADDPGARPASAIEVRREFEAAALGRRSRHTHNTRQMVWGAVAIAALAGLGVVRDRWSNRAIASSSQAAGATASSLLRASGTAANWRDGTRTIATFPGSLHCSSLVGGNRVVRVIWGTPRTAEDIDIASGVRSPSTLPSATYRDGCPQLSPDGQSLLFESLDETGSHIYLSSASGSGAKQLVRGVAPQWRRNNQEFVFNLDSRHVALFSIPTGQLTVIGDDKTNFRELAEKTVDASGTRVAIRYFTNTVDSLVVVQSLSDFTTLGRLLLPPSARSIRFSENGDRLLLSLDGTDGVSEMASTGWQNPALEKIGAVPGMDVRGVLNASSGSVITARTLRKDLWADESDGGRQLTHDGQSDSGAQSVRGDLVIQRRLPDGRFVMVLRTPDGTETQVTNGPLDMFPVFYPDGSRWLYASYTSRQLVECRVSDRTCHARMADQQTPTLPSIDLTGTEVAYVTHMNARRLHLYSLSNGARTDLGPSATECAPFWSSRTRLWVGELVAGNQQEWAEIDTVTRSRTGRSFSIAHRPERPCRIPPPVVAERTSRLPHVLVGVYEASELMLHRRAL